MEDRKRPGGNDVARKLAKAPRIEGGCFQRGARTNGLSGGNAVKNFPAVNVLYEAERVIACIAEVRASSSIPVLRFLPRPFQYRMAFEGIPCQLVL